MVIVAEEIACPEFYHLPGMILKSGIQAFFGWIVMLLVPLVAVVVILRHFLARGCHARGTVFFQITHVCFLWFLLHVVVCGHIVACLCIEGCVADKRIVAENLISLAIGIGIAIFSCGAVSLVLRRFPRADIMSCFGLAAIAASISVIAAGLLMIRPFMMRKISDVVTSAGYSMPVICSPEEFMEAEHD